MAMYAAIINLRTVYAEYQYGVTSARKYINSMRRRWNSTAIKRMRERLKPGPFSSFSGLGTRLADKCLCLLLYMSLNAVILTEEHTSTSMYTIIVHTYAVCFVP